MRVQAVQQTVGMNLVKLWKLGIRPAGTAIAAGAGGATVHTAGRAPLL